MNSYHFSLGNSTDGPIGFCARVLADTPEEAVAIMKTIVAQKELGSERAFRNDEGADQLEYLSVYFNSEAISTEDIDEWEEAGDHHRPMSK